MYVYRQELFYIAISYQQFTELWKAYKKSEPYNMEGYPLNSA